MPPLLFYERYSMTISGIVFYEGPSRIDGSPIVGVATLQSKNRKTGNLVQTWIIRSDLHPVTAIATGEDSAICGDCPLRGFIRPASERVVSGPLAHPEFANKGRTCYVLANTAPTQVFRTYQGGKYPKLGKEHASLFEGRGLRYGSYGDPVAIPISAWNPLAKLCTGRSEPGYTHQWRDRRFRHWAKRVMASTHSVAENNLAHSLGWRTFRTIVVMGDIQSNEILCPASVEAGNTATCETCGACNGRHSDKDARRSVAIVTHGSHNKISMLRSLITSRS